MALTIRMLVSQDGLLSFQTLLRGVPKRRLVLLLVTLHTDSRFETKQKVGTVVSPSNMAVDIVAQVGESGVLNGSNGATGAAVQNLQRYVRFTPWIRCDLFYPQRNV